MPCGSPLAPLPWVSNLKGLHGLLGAGSNPVCGAADGGYRHSLLLGGTWRHGLFMIALLRSPAEFLTMNNHASPALHAQLAASATAAWLLKLAAAACTSKTQLSV